MQRAIADRATQPRVAGWLALTFAASALLAVLMGALWAAGGVAPKVVAFAGLSTALLHTTMVRSTWMPSGIVSAVPLVAGLLFTVVTYMFESDEMGDAAAGTALVIAMVAYVVRSMIAMHARRSELIAARARAEQASRFKSRFLATISHEIRTPLNAIHGMTQLLREDSDPDLIEERTALLLAASSALETIVDEVLDHARIEAGRYRLRLEDADPADAAHSVVSAFHKSAADKGLTLELQVAARVPAQARFDVLRMQQVLGNLVSNAVKYSDDGRVLVRLDAVAAPDGWTVTASVDDQGPGLTEEQAARAFQEFERIEREDARAVAGTGLGLPIARGFARLMGGDVTVNSRPGTGTTFIFRFHAGVAAERPTVEAPEGLAGTAWFERADPILVVDDNETNRYLVRSFLRTSGLETIEAANGSEALVELGRRRFSLVLLDMRMPVLDGPSTVAQMRRAGGQIAATPVIALTADAIDDAHGRYRDLGLAGYLTKPVRRGDLLRHVGHVLERCSADAA